MKIPFEFGYTFCFIVFVGCVFCCIVCLVLLLLFVSLSMFVFLAHLSRLGSQGELIVYPSSRRPSVRRTSSTILKDLLL